MNNVKRFLAARSVEIAKGFANMRSSRQKERNEMRKLMIVAAMAFVVTFAFAQDAEIVKVYGRGVGTDKMEALKDAYRDAVERAVGLYVDAEQMMKNEELVKDQILTQSNAYIENYKVAKESTAGNGLVSVTILANVRKRALTKKIRDAMPSSEIRLSDVNKNLHAQILTDFKANDDAVSIVKNELRDLQPLKQLMKLSLAATKPVVEPVEEDSSLVRLWYPVKVEVDAAKYYKEFAPRWSRILEQIKIAPSTCLDMRDNAKYRNAYKKVLDKRFGPSRRNLCGVMTRCDEAHIPSWGSAGTLEKWGVALNEEYRGMVFLNTRIDGKEYVLHGFGRIKNYCTGVIEDDFYNRRCRVVERVFCIPRSSFRLQPQIDGECNFWIGLITAGKGPTLSGKLYKIPLGCVNEIVKWQHLAACNTNTAEGSEYRETAPEVEYKLCFVDGDGTEIAGRSFALRNLDVLNFGCVLLNEYNANGNLVEAKRLWLITPLVGGFAKSYIKWISVDILQDDVAKIASAIIKPVEE